MSDPRRPEPRLSAEAEERLDALRESLPAEIFNAAKARAREAHLDVISARHVDEAARAFSEDGSRRSQWKEWSDTLGGAFVGIGGAGLLTELTKPNLLDLNRLALIMSIIATIIGITAIAWAKQR